MFSTRSQPRLHKESSQLIQLGSFCETGDSEDVITEFEGSTALEAVAKQLVKVVDYYNKLQSV
jgi:hypothetical protein